jgi:hypothetical protein
LSGRYEATPSLTRLWLFFVRRKRFLSLVAPKAILLEKKERLCLTDRFDILRQSV